MSFRPAVRFAYAALALSSVLVLPAYADTFGPSAGGPIPDSTSSNVTPGTLTTTITIANPGTILSLDAVTLTTLVHSFVGDLEVTLTAPNGDDVHLFSRVGVTTGGTSSTGFGDGSNLSGNYVFVNSGGADFVAAATGTTGNVPPGTYDRSTAANGTVPGGQDTDTYSIFAGDLVAGTWTLTINDWFQVDTGSLGSWSLAFTLQPAQAPEPTTLALLGIGLAAFGFSRRRSS